eukprot:1040106-Amphidinium_carterae.1
MVFGLSRDQPPNHKVAEMSQNADHETDLDRSQEGHGLHYSDNTHPTLVLGENDPKTLDTRYNMAVLLADCGRRTEAVQIFESVLRGPESNWNSHALDTLVSQRQHMQTTAQQSVGGRGIWFRSPLLKVWRAKWTSRMIECSHAWRNLQKHTKRLTASARL